MGDMRKPASGVGVVLLLAVVAFLIFGGPMLGRAVKYGVEAFGPKFAKVPVTVGSVEISLFSGKGEIKNLVVGNPAGFSSTPALKVGRIKIDVDVSSLLSKTLVIEDITVDSPRVNYEMSLEGSNINRLVENLKSNAAKPSSVSSEATDSKSEVATGSRDVLVKEFSVNGGSVRLAATMLDGRGVDLPLPGVELKDVGSGQGAGVVAWQLSAAFRDSILGAVKNGGLIEAGGSLLDGAAQGSSTLLDQVGGLLGGSSATRK